MLATVRPMSRAKLTPTEAAQRVNMRLTKYGRLLDSYSTKTLHIQCVIQRHSIATSALAGEVSYPNLITKAVAVSQCISPFSLSV